MRPLHLSRRATASALLASLSVAALTTLPAHADPVQTRAAVPTTPDWTVAGQNSHNTRAAATERTLRPDNIARLSPRWTLTTGGDVAATPTVSRGVVYAPDMGGNLWAVDAKDGTVIWSKRVSEYTGVPGEVSRSSPAVDGDQLIIGNGAAGVVVDSPIGAHLMGIDAHTGNLRWRTRIDPDPTALMTSSPLVDDGIAYVGVSSRSTSTSTFRGSVVAVDTRSGELLWKTYTVPVGYTGGAVWGSTPVVDHQRNLLYVGTGQNYRVPEGVCTNPVQTDCAQPVADDYKDSILALDLRTGAVAWAHQTLSSDVWTSDPWTLPSAPGPDFDFGSGPNLYTTVIDGHRRDMLGIGQKSGDYWALDPDTGSTIWRTNIGPGSSLGGIEWGSAVDGRRVYAAIANKDRVPYTITSATGETTTIDGGSWTALDAATGRIIWQTADPQSAFDLGFVTVANGVVYAGSAAVSGDTMYALDAATGAIRWRFASGGAVVSGAAVVDGTVYWGSGYYFPAGADNNKLYALALPDR